MGSGASSSSSYQHEQTTTTTSTSKTDVNDSYNVTDSYNTTVSGGRNAISGNNNRVTEYTGIQSADLSNILNAEGVALNQLLNSVGVIGQGSLRAVVDSQQAALASVVSSQAIAEQTAYNLVAEFAAALNHNNNPPANSVIPTGLTISSPSTVGNSSDAAAQSKSNTVLYLSIAGVGLAILALSKRG